MAKEEDTVESLRAEMGEMEQMLHNLYVANHSLQTSLKRRALVAERALSALERKITKEFVLKRFVYEEKIGDLEDEIEMLKNMIKDSKIDFDESQYESERLLTKKRRELKRVESMADAEKAEKEQLRKEAEEFERKEKALLEKERRKQALMKKKLKQREILAEKAKNEEAAETQKLKAKKKEEEEARKLKAKKKEEEEALKLKAKKKRERGRGTEAEREREGRGRDTEAEGKRAERGGEV